MAHNAGQHTRLYTPRSSRICGSNRGHAFESMDKLCDLEFRRMFRVNRDIFDDLERNIKPDIRRHVQKARNAVGQGKSGEITNRTRLGLTFRWLAGGIYVDICYAWGIGHSTFYHEWGVLWPTIEALDKHLMLGFPVNDPYEIERSVLEIGSL
ncbi:hypothetical protein B484DRAFT_438105 [Ochromonadaceae sp. CCMP2298]|nr:hypothetical protein B484DRAFT_438105 [Ochromonadaceae sp. CCMP2298]